VHNETGLTRYRKSLIQERAREANRVHKLLEDAGIKLATVARDVLGTSGRAMLEALVQGTSDPAVLAELARGRMRAKLPALRQALAGHFRPHHAFLATQILAHLDHLEGTVATLSERIAALLAPFADAVQRLDTIPGVNQRTAEVLIAEIGVDMSRFPTAAHLASWAGMCPANNITGGKRHPAGSLHGNRWLGEILNQCAVAASHTRDTYLAAQYWRLARRIGKKKAAVAVGHSILVICWHLLAGEDDYRDLGGAYFTRRTDRDKRRDHLIRQLHDLGYGVSLTELPAA
jgi:transposase